MSIGWIGTGVMGKSMCKHLLNKGYNLLVYNRTENKTKELIELGARLSSPKEIGQTCDIIFTMLGYPKDVEETILHKETGLLNYMKKGSLLIDHTTSSPDLAIKIHLEAQNRGINSLDAPVSGGDIGAQKGTLVVMVGGDKETLEKANPYFNCYSSKIGLMGSAGRGQVTKMTNQIIIASTMIGVCEGLLYAQKNGLDLLSVIDLLGGGAAASFSLNNLGVRVTKRDFEPGFYVEHFVKDMSIALEEAKRLNLKLPGLELAYSLYNILIQDGLNRKGTQGLMLALEKLNKI